MDWRQYIRCDPNILGGKPVIAGTRVPVDLLLGKLAAGETIEQILIDYPPLTEEAIPAAIAFADEVLRTDFVYPTQRQKSQIRQSNCMALTSKGLLQVSLS